MEQRKFTSIKEIILKIYRDLGMENEREDYATLIEWIGEAIDLIGYKDMYETKEIEIEIKDYKGLLPCDYIHYDSVRYGGENIKSNEDNYNFFNKFIIEYPYIKINNEIGNIILRYYGYKLDKEGLPMIVDDINVKEAIVEYIIKKYSRIKYLTKQISLNEYIAIEQMANRKLDKARSMLAMLSPSEFRDLSLKWNRLTKDIYNFNQKKIVK